MFCLNENNIYHLYSQGIDMRKGVEGLCGIIRTYQYSPTNQEVYVFCEQITYIGKNASLGTWRVCSILQTA